jgi:GTPase KRas protein
MIVLGNKKDMESRREVAEDEGRRFASDSHGLFMETRWAFSCINGIDRSAKYRTNIEEAFYDVVREIRRTRGGQQKNANGGGNKRQSQMPGRSGAAGGPAAGNSSAGGCCIVL